MLRLLLCAVALHVARTEGTCGCSWSSQNGCGMSGPQFVAAVSESKTERVCESSTPKDDKAEMECTIREKIKEAANHASECFALDARQCMRATMSGKLCQWAAQGANQCGIDEEKLLVMLVGQHSVNHPLLKAIILHDKCSELGEQFCEANPDCSWVYEQNGAALCDVNPSTFFHMLIQKPVVLQLTQFVVSGAVCRAQYEHGDPAVCKAPCILESGICRLDISRVKAPDMGQLLEVVCGKAARNWECPAACEPRPGDLTSCHAPRELPPSFAPENMRLTEEDMLVAEIFMVLQGSTMVYEHNCNELDENPQACNAVGPVCGQKVTANFQHASGQPGQTSRNVPAAPGMKGVFGKMLSAVSDGMSEHKLSQFLLDHPDEVEKVTKKLGVPKVGELIEKHPEAAAGAAAVAAKVASGVGSMLKSATGPAPPPPVPPPMDKLPPAPVIPERQSDALIDLTDTMNKATGANNHRKSGLEIEEEGLPAQWYTNPWTVAAGTTISAAICAGIAMGALCHAQMFRSARAPLLVEEVMQDYEVAPLGSS